MLSWLSKLEHFEKLNKNLRYLYLHKIIRQIGFGLISLFSPIFLYVISGRMEFVLIYFGLASLLYVLILPWWAKLISFYNLRSLMIVGNLFFVLYLLLYYFLTKLNFLAWPVVIALIATNVVSKAFYWIPYHIDFARFVNAHHRGRQLSFLGILVAIVGIILPFLSALIVNYFGFSTLFLTALVVFIFSTWPLRHIGKIRENYSFGYRQTFAKIFNKQHWRTNLSYAADGFQSNVGYIVWPIFIFIVLKGAYLKVGLYSALIVLGMVVLRYTIGELVDRLNENKIIKTGSWLYALGWLFKAAVASGWQIFLAGVYHNFTQILYKTPLDALTYEIAADEEHYIDEFTILKEMALHMGKLIMVILSLIILKYWGVKWVFVLSALIAMAIGLINKEEFYFVRRSRLD